MSARAHDSSKPTSLLSFLHSLEQGFRTCSSDDPPWFEPGVVCEIDERTYWYFLELLPPRWMHGSWFAFGEGTGPFRLFWKVKDAHFARELTDEETRVFSELSGASLYL